MGVSKNRGTPKSSILIGFSLIFTIHLGYLYFWRATHIIFNRLNEEHLPTKNRCRVFGSSSWTGGGWTGTWNGPWSRAATTNARHERGNQESQEGQVVEIPLFTRGLMNHPRRLAGFLPSTELGGGNSNIFENFHPENWGRFPI